MVLEKGRLKTQIRKKGTKMYTAEGLIEINADEWREFIIEHLPGGDTHGCFFFGPPLPNLSNNTIEINFAISSSEDISPSDWAQKPKAVLQWEELEEENVEPKKTQNERNQTHDQKRTR